MKHETRSDDTSHATCLALLRGRTYWLEVGNPLHDAGILNEKWGPSFSALETSLRDLRALSPKVHAFLVDRAWRKQSLVGQGRNQPTIDKAVTWLSKRMGAQVTPPAYVAEHPLRLDHYLPCGDCGEALFRAELFLDRWPNPLLAALIGQWKLVFATRLQERIRARLDASSGSTFYMNTGASGTSGAQGIVNPPKSKEWNHRLAKEGLAVLQDGGQARTDRDRERTLNPGSAEKREWIAVMELFGVEEEEEGGRKEEKRGVMFGHEPLPRGGTRKASKTKAAKVKRADGSEGFLGIKNDEAAIRQHLGALRRYESVLGKGRRSGEQGPLRSELSIKVKELVLEMGAHQAAVARVLGRSRRTIEALLKEAAQ